MKDKAYENAIAVLRKGHIPANFKEVSANAKKTYYETMEFFDAVVECAYRLEQSNKIMKAMLEAERSKNAGFSETH